MPSLVFILGREPHLSVAEIAAVVGDGADWARAELSAEALVIPVESRESRVVSRELIERLGGTIKIGEVWRTVAYGKTPGVGRAFSPSVEEERSDGKTLGVKRATPGVLTHAVEAIGKFILGHTSADRKTHFGYSVYDLGAGTKRTAMIRQSLTRGAAAQKAWLKEHGRTVRWVTSREPTLSSVVVGKNHLLPEDNGIEVLVLVGQDHVLLARTLAVQPFTEWSRRDYGRPSRDARSGMLPPKLARAMINMALARSTKHEARNSKPTRKGRPEEAQADEGTHTMVDGFPRSARDDAAASVSDFRFQISDFTILDPFCGSGTILTEAMALGIPRIIGTDVDVKAVADAKENVEWLRRQGKLADVRVERCDVRKLSTCVAPRSVDAIVTEPYLGPPGGLGPSPSRSPSQRAGEKVRAQVIRDLHALYLDAFREFAKVLKPGGRVVFIVPEFQRDHSPIRTNRRMERGSERRGDTAKDRVDITRDVERLGFRRVNPFPSALRAHATLGGREDLPYARPDQHVGRRILVFVRT